MFLLILSVFIQPVVSPSQTASLYTKAPKDWKAEVIPFPLGFAPEIKLEGVEELRFAPGMYKPEAPDFFSYTFIWWLEDAPPITGEMLRKNLDLYYKGLYKAVSKLEKKDVSSFKVAVQATRERSWTPLAQQVYRGSIQWKEPFVEEKNQTLNLMIASWTCPDGKHTAVQVLVSPQDWGHEVWNTMKAMEAGKCGP